MKITMLKKLFIISSLLSGVTFNVFAETVYVSDSLRVGVRAEPDNAYAPVGVVKTGMKLEVLESQQGYLKIKTNDGLTGWIKKIYVIEEAPAVTRLKQMQTQNDELAAQTNELQATISTLKNTNVSLTGQVEDLKEDRSRLQLLQAKSNSSQHEGKTAWYSWLVALVFVAAGSFFGGMQWCRYQTTKRLGGLRL